MQTQLVDASSASINPNNPTVIQGHEVCVVVELVPDLNVEESGEGTNVGLRDSWNLAGPLFCACQPTCRPAGVPQDAPALLNLHGTTAHTDRPAAGT